MIQAEIDFMYLYVFNACIYMKTVHVKQLHAVWRQDCYLFKLLCYSVVCKRVLVL